MTDSLVADCEAVLAGRYAEHCLLGRREVPVWAWTNLLAHGTEAELRRPRIGVGGHASAAAGTHAFHVARAELAGRVLDVARVVGSLAELQSSTLVPLELAIAERPACRSWDASAWANAVLVALGDRDTSEPTPS